MALLPLPEEVKGLAYDAGKFSTFVLDEVVPDDIHMTFGRDDLTHGSELWIRGHILWKPSISWCQSMPKVTVTLPTLYRPIQVQLKLVTTAEDETGESWIGFFVGIEDICTLTGWQNWAYFDITVRTAFQEKHGKHVQYSPANNCWGWSKCFKVAAMTSCKGNPFLIDIGIEHDHVPSFLRLPYISLKGSKDDPENFNDEWGKVMMPQSNDSGNDTPRSKGETSNSSGRKQKGNPPRPMILDQEIRRSPLDYFQVVLPGAVPTGVPRPTTFHASGTEYRNNNSYGRNGRRKVRSAY